MGHNLKMEDQTPDAQNEGPWTDSDTGTVLSR